MSNKRVSFLGEVEGLHHLINATKKQLTGTTEALEETQRRTDALNQMNIEVEQTIESIPVSTPQTVTTTTHERSGLLWWRRSRSSTTTDTVMVSDSCHTIHFDYIVDIFCIGAKF